MKKRIKRMKPLSIKTEMILIAGSNPSRKASERLTQMLHADPAMAKRIGASLERARDDFARAYPGETRTRRISNAAWRRTGHSHMADLNEALGLAGS